MLTREDDVDAHALCRQGWTITAIAKHLGHDRKTIRAYLAGDRVAGQRASNHPDLLEPFLGYATQRLLDDPLVGVRPHVLVRVGPHVLVFGPGIVAWVRLLGPARGGP